MSYRQHEIKFVLPAFRVDAVRRVLRRNCRADAAFPRARVWTVYFDTAELESLAEKDNSDYLKSKLRLRWYEGSTPSERWSPAFLEIKDRRGSRRRKTRIQLDGEPHPRHLIAGGALDRTGLTALVHRALAADPVRAARLRPVLALRYRRERFSDRLNGARISLDSDIVSLVVDPVASLSRRFLPAGMPLDTAVVEFKSPSAFLPPSLRHLTALGCRRASFSKYEACFRIAA